MSIASTTDSATAGGSKKKLEDLQVTQGRSRVYMDAALLFIGFLTLCVLVLLHRLPIVTNVLYAPRNVYDFGTVARGTDVRQTFVVRNLHPWPVTVLRVQGCCGCTKAFVGKEKPFRLKPLESVAVNATLDTSGKQGKTVQAITVVTSDNAMGTPLILSGFVTEQH